MLSVLLSAGYNLPDLNACRADWASLELGSCQRILCTDMRTVCKGAQVCQAWMQFTKGNGPRRMDFSTENFGDRQEPDKDQAESNRNAVLGLISRQADNTLEDLTIVTAYDLRGTMQDICNVLHEKSFPVLTTLHIDIGYLYDWEVFKELPVTLKSLYLGSLFLTITQDNHNIGECFDLGCFNHLVRLEELSLLLEGNDDVHSEVTGDLLLPALRSCCLERAHFYFGNDETYDILLTEFTATGLSKSCLIMADQGVTCQLCSDRFVWTVVDQFLGPI